MFLRYITHVKYIENLRIITHFNTVIKNLITNLYQYPKVILLNEKKYLSKILFLRLYPKRFNYSHFDHGISVQKSGKNILRNHQMDNCFYIGFWDEMCKCQILQKLAWVGYYYKTVSCSWQPSILLLNLSSISEFESRKLDVLPSFHFLC